MLADATAVPSPSSVLLGLEGFVVLAVAEAGGEIEMLIETDADLVGCPECGAVATTHGRRRHCVRDLPVGGRPVVLTWCKRIWRCEQPQCPVRTWSEQHPAIRPRSVLSERAAWWATEQVGRRRRTVAAVARELGGAAWRTVMRAVRRLGQPLVDDPDRLAGVRRLGVDEHAFLRATATRATQFATGVIDTTSGRPARLLDVVPGRTGSALSAWLTSQQRAFREQITVASLDPFRGYATALTRCLPQATRVVDGFHITRLGGQTLTEGPLPRPAADPRAPWPHRRPPLRHPPRAAAPRRPALRPSPHQARGRTAPR